jgi:hypothetical protein
MIYIFSKYHFRQTCVHPAKLEQLSWFLAEWPIETIVLLYKLTLLKVR